MDEQRYLTVSPELYGVPTTNLIRLRNTTPPTEYCNITYSDVKSNVFFERRVKVEHACGRIRFRAYKILYSEHYVVIVY